MIEGCEHCGGIHYGSPRCPGYWQHWPCWPTTGSTAMTDHSNDLTYRGLVQAVAENDTGALCALADWLEERDDSRAERLRRLAEYRWHPKYALSGLGFFPCMSDHGHRASCWFCEGTGWTHDIHLPTGALARGPGLFSDRICVWGYNGSPNKTMPLNAGMCGHYTLTNGMWA